MLQVCKHKKLEFILYKSFQNQTYLLEAFEVALKV